MNTLTKKVKSNFKNKLKGAANRSAAPKTQEELLENQLSNYRTRLSSIGKDPEELTDDRNFLEKFLNLEKDQNVLFDIFF